MTALTNPPFTRDAKHPPLHLRDLTPEELEQWRRMTRKQERFAREWRETHVTKKEDAT